MMSHHSTAPYDPDGVMVEEKDFDGVMLDKDDKEGIFVPVVTDRRKKCLRRCFHWLVCLFLVAGALISISVALTGSPNPIDYFVPVDPPGLNEAVLWHATDSTGLQLRIENACDDTWTAEFDASVAQWNATDALHLSIRRDLYDYDCSAAYGRLRVCNGDYGNTDWKGINVVFMNYDRIVHSVSKLNDFHLKTPAQRAYTMCHELGHGFGLPHTDENHFNRDRGDCMDYTDRPQNNLRPGSFNLNLLVQMYGTPYQTAVAEETEAPPTSQQQWGNGSPEQESVFQNDEEDEEDEDDEKEKDKDKDDRGRRYLRLLDEEDDDDDDDEEDSKDDSADDSLLMPNYQRLTRRAVKACKERVCAYDVGRGNLISVYKMLA